MKLDNKRLRLILLGLIGVVSIGFIATCFEGLSMLSSKSQGMVGLKLQSRVLNDQLDSLGTAKKQVQSYSYIKNVAAEVIPNDKDQAQAVLEINQLAQQSGIALASVGFPTSNLGSSSSSLISQAEPVSGIGGLYSIQITITPEAGSQVPADQQVTYPKMLDFLNRIENNQRTAQITQLQVQPQASNDTSAGITFSLSLNIFIKP